MKERQILRKGIETRNLILQVAAKLFAEHGYHATSVADVMNRAKLAKGTLYQYFSAKDLILEALRERYFSELEGFWTTRVGEAGWLPPNRLEMRGSLTRIWADFWDFSTERRDLSLIFFGEFSNRGLDLQRSLRPLENWLQELKNRGTARTLLPAGLLAFVLVQSFLQSLNRYYVLEKRGTARGDFVDLFVQMSLDVSRCDF